MSVLDPPPSVMERDGDVSSPAAAAAHTLQAIRYSPTTSTRKASLEILNQRLLPHETVYIPINTGDDAFTAIREMYVRGAPAIAIVAALSLAVECQSEEGLRVKDGAVKTYPRFMNVDEDAAKAKDNGKHVDGLEKEKKKEEKVKSYDSEPGNEETAIPNKTPGSMAYHFVASLGLLLASRPTAVNLGDAVDKLSAVVDAAAVKDGATGDDVQAAYIRAAERMLVDDVADNTAIGRHGARWIMFHCGNKEKVSVLTHCNTGSLATAGYGTALGIVRSLHGANQLERAYYTETRPYNQGSRLTGYELLHDGIPCTLVTDSMAAALMERFRKKDNGLAAVIVGADRVAANGDTANKIGTYALAVLARFHGVKFLVAAPRTTIDLATPSGEEIVIEERPPNEMFTVRGPEVLGYSKETDLQSVDVEKIATVSTAAIGTRCWNPAFDVTPASLIDGIVTEVGVAEKDEYGNFDLQHLFSLKEVLQDLAAGEKDMPDPKEGP